MPNIDIQRQHHLGRDQACSLVEDLAARMQAKLGVKTHWAGDALHFSRSGIDGSIEVEDTSIRVRARLGMLMAAFKPMLEEEIRQRLDEHLGSTAG
jgi:putative polyhydroxyalkanoate system protein